MGLFNRKKKEVHTIEMFAPPGSDNPKNIIRIGEYNTDSNYWIIYLDTENQSVIGDGPLPFNSARNIAKSRGLPYVFIRTSVEEEVSLETIVNVFIYRFGR